MYLIVKNIKGVRYLYLMQSVHIKGKRSPAKKLVKSYGRYDALPEDFRKNFEDEKQKKELTRRLEQDVRREQLLQANVSVPVDNPASPSPETNFNRAYALCYGHLPLRSIWNDDLGLRYKVDYLQKTSTGIDSWRISDLLFYLCATKVLNPQSYLGACVSKSNYLFCPWNNIAQDNFYRGLDFVYEHRHELLEHAVKKHHEGTKTEIKVAFFDCTNLWCETPYDDVTWQMIRFVRKTRRELADNGISSDAIEAYLESEAFAEDLAQELELRKDEVLRMRGKSKESRYAQPIVTVALAIDQTGFPIDCEVFAGNLSETRTIKPMLESLKKKYSIKNVYFVADRGLNTTEALDRIKQTQLGFVVAQKVSNQKDEIRQQMLELNGYRNCEIVDNEFRARDGELRSEAFRYKVCDHEKVAYVKEADGDGVIKRKKITVKCKIVYTYSPERRKRDLMDLENQIAKATRAITEAKLMGNPFGTGWRSLVKTQKEVQENKEDKEQYRATGLKQEVIEERKRIAGYAALVFDAPKDGNQQLTEEQVLSTYHKLVSIEDCFRVMKSNFSIRPVHVRLYERITAHCYLCVFALMMVKIIQQRLEKLDVTMTSEQIATALTQAQVVPLPSKTGSIETFLNIGQNPQFHTAENTGKGRRQWAENDLIDSESVWEEYKAKRRQRASDTDLILQASGLKPLRLYNTMGELKIRLGLKSLPDSAMVALEHVRYVQELKS